MANPFDMLFGENTPVMGADRTPLSNTPFGPNAGVSFGGDNLGNPTGDAPEQLPWGLDAQAQPADQYLERTPNDSARMLPAAMRPSQTPTGLVPQSPWEMLQNATRGLFANPNAQQNAAQNQGTPQQGAPYMPPRPAAQSGTIMGFLDTLNGVPTSSQLKVHEEARQQQLAGSAAGEVLKRVQEIRAQSPEIPQNMLQAQIFSDPAFLHAAMKTDPQKMAQFVDTVMKGIYGTPQLHNVGPDSVLTTFNPTSGKPPEQVFQAPKSFRPGDVTRATLLRGDDPKWKDMGINMGGKPDQMWEVEYARDTQGQEYIKKFTAPGGGGVNISMGDKVEYNQLEKAVKEVADIKQQQIAVTGMARVAEKLDRALSSTGAGALGPYGFATQIGQAAFEQAKAIAADAGVSFNPETYAQSWKAFQGLDKRAGDAAEIKSNILSLAVFVAKANNRSGNISNKDVDNALTQIGGRFGSLVELRAGLNSLVKNAVQHTDDYLAIVQPGFNAPSGKASVNPPKSLKEILPELGLGRWVPNDKETLSTKEGAGQNTGAAQVPLGTQRMGKDGRMRTLTKPNWQDPNSWTVEGQ